ncbi:neuropeptide FF receptor 2-like [Montipora foliosa]|uniref:neuropeptide FF receptor 2-like n=1 Tax=Montipora foliosa TaxID=591990 RepID=UPI0035F1B10F
MNGSNTTTFAQCLSEPAFYMWTLRLVYSAIFLLGTVGNAVVCFAIVKRKAPQNSCNVFTFNLAFHDLILVILYVPTQMIALEHCYAWILGELTCQLVYIILPICQSASVGTLLAITADRYRAIVFPVKSRLTRKTVLLVIAAIWAGSIVTALPLVFVITEISPVPGVVYCVESWPSETLLQAYWLSMFIIQYFLPLSAIAILAGITAYSLRKNAYPEAMESCEQSEMFRTTVRRRVKQTKRITKMLIALVFLYAICMLPQHVVYTFWTMFGDLMSKSYREQANIVANIFPIANSALNAIAYGTLNKEFKGVFKALFRFACCKVSQTRDIARRESQRRTLSTTDGSSVKKERMPSAFALGKRTGNSKYVSCYAQGTEI